MQVEQKESDSRSLRKSESHEINEYRKLCSHLLQFTAGLEIKAVRKEEKIFSYSFLLS